MGQASENERANCVACGAYHGSEGRALDCLVRSLLVARKRALDAESQLEAIRAIGRGYKASTSPPAPAEVY